MALQAVHRDPTGQVALYQSEDRYFQTLEKFFGRRFLDYRRRWGETAGRGRPGEFPLSLDLAVNSGCQLSCLMCPLPASLGGRQVRLMDGDLWERLMAQAREHDLPALTLGLGSEPLLHPGVAGLVARAVRAGIMDIRLGTNGQLLTDQLARALIDSRLTRLEISVDAARPATYRLIRGGRLDSLTRAIERFLELRQKAASSLPLLRLSFLRLAQNEGELPEFLQRWGTAADLISIQEPIWFPGSRLPRPASAHPLAPVCAHPWQRLAVNWEGRVWPCCSWYGADLLPPEAGRRPLAELWRSPEMERLRLSLTSGPPPPACGQCQF
jgi:wyosine [tRNA(Phe)-imidazoG37] synthetase (radical SAM superfamily)